jgi:transglutaminase-like putative cysteine protease
MLSAYEVETKISTARVPLDYDTSSRLYERFTTPSSLVPSDDATLIRTARSVVGRERNPYLKALAVYNSVVGLLSYDAAATSVLESLKTRKGDASVYSLLFTAMLRATGVPARPVAGYVVGSAGKAARHLWAEFYLEQLGWVPVDPAIADGLKFGDFPRVVNPASWYFGNMDSQHIIFSRGLAALKPMDPSASVVTRRDAPGLQTIHEEYSGGITGYTARWTEIEILGIY